MRTFLLAGILVIGMASANPVDSGAGLRAVNDGASAFSVNFLKKVAETNRDNLICSPLSVDIVLAMLSVGARGNTLKQLQSGLQLPVEAPLFDSGYSALVNNLNNVQNVELKLANKIFTSERFELEPSYITLLREIFYSEVQKVDFQKNEAAAKIINDWAAAQTNNRIQKLFEADSFNADTALVLTNAIYFKGQWAVQFSPSATQNLPFNVDEKTVKDVPTMYKKDRFNTGVLENLDARWVELPYKGNEFSLLIILPNAINGLDSLQANLDKINVTEVLNSGYKVNMDLYLPKFKIETELNLKSTIEDLGMGEMFSNVANLSGISKSPLKVSAAIQKAFIEVNEEGSEAAAVTGLKINLMSMPIPPETLHVDRPFMFSIVHKKYKDARQFDVEYASPLFVGSIRLPKN